MPILGIIDSAKSGNLFPNGSYESIASSSPSGSSTVTFSAIPQTYAFLQLRISGGTARAAVSDSLNMTFNGITTTTYHKTELFWNGTSGTSANAASPAANLQLTASLPGANAISDAAGLIIINIPNYTNATYNKTASWISGFDNNASTSQLYLGEGAWTNTAAISSIGFVTATGTSFRAGTVFSLYGVKGS